MARLIDIENHKNIKGRLADDVIEILDWSVVATHEPKNPASVLDSGHLLAGFANTDETLEYLEKFGISGEAMVEQVESLRYASEYADRRYKQSFIYRGIFSLAAVLACQEQKSLEYKIKGKHLVDAVRRSPQSMAYQSLSRLASDPNF